MMNKIVTGINNMDIVLDSKKNILQNYISYIRFGNGLEIFSAIEIILRNTSKYSITNKNMDMLQIMVVLNQKVSIS
jgi:hypothetical protein